MDDEMLELTSRSDAEVVRRLEAFADLRLSPSLAARARMRTAVMDAAHQRSTAMQAEAATTAITTLPVAALDRSRRPVWRRPMVAFAAATLIIGMVAGSAMASTPGGPLYGARLWAEMANLPATGTARAQAEAQRLGQRLEEVQRASATGDEPAAEAALSAYASILAEATAGTVGDPAAEATLKTAVARHVVVLISLADRAPAPAKAALDQAVASSTIVLDSLGGNDGGTGGSAGSGNGTTGGGYGGNGGNGNGANGGTGGNAGSSAQPGSGGDPAEGTPPGKGKPTDKPAKQDATPKPTKTARPHPTPRNGPNGQPTQDPGGSGEHGTTP